MRLRGIAFFALLIMALAACASPSDSRIKIQLDKISVAACDVPPGESPVTAESNSQLPKEQRQQLHRLGFRFVTIYKDAEIPYQGEAWQARCVTIRFGEKGAVTQAYIEVGASNKRPHGIVCDALDYPNRFSVDQMLSYLSQAVDKIRNTPDTYDVPVEGSDTRFAAECRAADS